MGEVRRRMRALPASEATPEAAPDHPVPKAGKTFSLTQTEKVAYGTINQQQQQLQAALQELAGELCDRLGVSRKTCFKMNPDGTVESVDPPAPPAEGK